MCLDFVSILAACVIIKNVPQFDSVVHLDSILFKAICQYVLEVFQHTSSVLHKFGSGIFTILGSLQPFIALAPLTFDLSRSPSTSRII